MPRSSPDALSLTRQVLRALIAFVLVAGALILALFVASLVAGPWVMRALGAGADQGHPMLYAGMRLIMVIGLCSVAVAHFVLKRLLAIVESVRAGDPFTTPNAARLREIAWAVLVLEVLHFGVGMIAAGVSTPAVPLHMSWGFSLTRWLAALLLFVLARVFEQGATMREELAATV